MSSKKHTGPKGQIELYCDSYETGNEMRSETSRARLISGDDDSLTLEIISEEKNFYPNGRDCHDQKQYKIKIDNIIEFIEKNGDILRRG